MNYCFRDQHDNPSCAVSIFDPRTDDAWSLCGDRSSGGFVLGMPTCEECKRELLDMRVAELAAALGFPGRFVAVEYSKLPPIYCSRCGAYYSEACPCG